ncbi:MAG: hypothetical protein KDB07_10745 [Planctomycetes bacterium]|nr:hypothetical protein [Planctomycetota bacterium]
MTPDHVKALSALCAREEWHKVKDLADRLVADYSPAARFFQAMARFHLNEHLSAWFCAERALEELGEGAEMLDLGGRIVAALGDQEASLAMHRKALRLAESASQAALSYNFAGSLLRMALWEELSKVVDQYGALWNDSMRRNLTISIELARHEGLTLERLQQLRDEVGVRPHHALDIALALHQAGEWQEADAHLARCQLVRNEPLIAANRVLLLLDAGETSRAFTLWRRERDYLRVHPDIAGALQGALLVAMGSLDAGTAHLAMHRPRLRQDWRMTQVRDLLATLHASALVKLERDGEADRNLIQELQSTVAPMPQTLAALRERRAAQWPTTVKLETWEVEYQRDGDHWVKVIVVAMSAESARVLAVETLPEGLQALPFSVCRIVDAPVRRAQGVLERWIGYRVSRNLLGGEA